MALLNSSTDSLFWDNDLNGNNDEHRHIRIKLYLGMDEIRVFKVPSHIPLSRFMSILKAKEQNCGHDYHSSSVNSSCHHREMLPQFDNSRISYLIQDDSKAIGLGPATHLLNRSKILYQQQQQQRRYLQTEEQWRELKNEYQGRKSAIVRMYVDIISSSS